MRSERRNLNKSLKWPSRPEEHQFDRQQKTNEHWAMSIARLRMLLFFERLHSFIGADKNLMLCVPVANFDTQNLETH